MSAGTHVRGLGPIRAVIACAALLALFLMHGVANSADSCHAGLPEPAAPHTAHGASATAPGAAQRVEPTRSSMSGMAGAAAAPSTGPGARYVGLDGADTHGPECLVAPPRDGVPTAAAALVAVGVVAAVVVPPGLGPAAGHGTRRGPPSGGRCLLTQVCIART